MYVRLSNGYQFQQSCGNLCEFGNFFEHLWDIENEH